MSNYTLLEMFHQVTEANVIPLKEGLSLLVSGNPSPQALEQVIQAAHTLWGVTRLTEIEEAANLAQLMKDSLNVIKDRFNATPNQPLMLDEEEIELLQHSGDLLLGISQIPEVDLSQWLASHDWDIKSTQRNLKKIIGTSTQDLEAYPQEPLTPSQTPVTLQTPVTSQPPVTPSQTPVTLQTPVTSQPPVTPSQPLVTLQTPVTSQPPPEPPKPVSSSLPPAPVKINIDDQEMLDLFRLEVETQVSVLNNGLLALENNPQSTQELEALMRAAHSIKGAARIVTLDMVVNLAHVMEDYFVAAQNHRVSLTPEQVDILLIAIDLLSHLSHVESAELGQWLGTHQEDYLKIQTAIAGILQGEEPAQGVSYNSPPEAIAVKPQILPNSAKIVAQKPTMSPAPLTPATPATGNTLEATSKNTQEIVKQTVPKNNSISTPQKNSLPNQDRVVRVSADNLNRIMGLAGESLIEANWLQPFADDLMSVKRRLAELSRSLEQLQECLDENRYQQEGKEYLELARQYEMECSQLFNDRIDDLELYVRRTANLSDRLYREVITSHMRPFADGIGGFPRMIRDLARQVQKQVKLEIFGKSTSVDRDILKKLEAPLTHILRNAVDHGIEPPEERIAAGKPAEAVIRLEAIHRAGMLAISVSDDGRGIDRERLRAKIINKNLATPDMVAQLSDVELLEFLFLPGFSTAKQVTEISGRGVGLDIAKSMAQEVGGTIRLTSVPGKGTSFHFQLPLTLSVVRTLLVEIAGKPYAIPLARIEQIVTLERSQIFDVENRQYFPMNQQNIGLIAAHQVLELPPSKAATTSIAVVVIGDQANTYGLVVDEFLGERDLVVRPLDPRLGKVPDISATALLSDGSPILILDVSDMVRSMDAILNVGQLAKVGIKSDAEQALQRKKILVVDDSITVREMERKLLENNGYYVDTAVNGAEAWNAIRTKPYELIITDIDMPKMNGIELVHQVKNHSRVHNIPIIVISYRDREEDRLQGLEAGADYYLTKSSFHDDTLIKAVVDLIGR